MLPSYLKMKKMTVSRYTPHFGSEKFLKVRLEPGPTYNSLTTFICKLKSNPNFTVKHQPILSTLFNCQVFSPFF